MPTVIWLKLIDFIATFKRKFMDGLEPVSMDGSFFPVRRETTLPAATPAIFWLTLQSFTNLTENHLLRLGYSYANEDDDEFDDDSISDRHRVMLGFEFNFPFKM
ncbi:MAG: hypothetical protein U5J82_03390 [Desulfobacterales bacterium]|nr:hypothetical protein [Desulfobacterales bacterium]